MAGVVRVGEAAPDFNLPYLPGAKVSLAGHSGNDEGGATVRRQPGPDGLSLLDRKGVVRERVLGDIGTGKKEKMLLAAMNPRRGFRRDIRVEVSAS